MRNFPLFYYNKEQNNLIHLTKIVLQKRAGNSKLFVCTSSCLCIEQTITYRFSLFYEVKFVLRLAFHNRTNYYRHIFGRTNYYLYFFLQNKLQPTCRTNYNLCRTNYYPNLQNKLNLKNRTNYGRPYFGPIESRNLSLKMGWLGLITNAKYLPLPTLGNGTYP